MERGLLDPIEKAENMRSIYARETLNYGFQEAWEVYEEGFPSTFVQFMEE